MTVRTDQIRSIREARDGAVVAVDDGLGGTSTYAVVLWPESWLTIATMANAWFNGTFGNATMLALAGSVESFFLGDPDLFAAEVYNQYGSLFAPSDLAQSVANNLGLEGDANAALALRLRDALEAVTDPNPARVPYLRGQVLLDETEYFASLVDDPVYGEAARRFNAEIDAALKFANIPGTLNTATNADGSPVELPEETGDSTARVQGLRWGPVTGVAASENAPGRWPRGDGVVDDRLFGNASDEPGLDPRWLGDAPAPHGVAPTIELVAIPCLAQTETMGV